MILEELQRQLDLIQMWLASTTEPYDDWDWDGANLTVFIQDDVVERYSYDDLKGVIKNFENYTI